MIQIEETQQRPVVSVEATEVIETPSQPEAVVVVEPVYQTVAVKHTANSSLNEYISTLAILAILVIVFGRSIKYVGALIGSLLVFATGVVGMLYLFLQAVL